MAMLKSIRILLAIAAHYDYEIWQMDVKTAFLNGNLSEEVYMTQPEGFISKDSNQVCKLQRSIYGLKQASRSWNIRFDETIKEFGFSQNVSFPSWLNSGCFYSTGAFILLITVSFSGIINSYFIILAFYKEYDNYFPRLNHVFQKNLFMLRLQNALIQLLIILFSLFLMQISAPFSS